MEAGRVIIKKRAVTITNEIVIHFFFWIEAVFNVGLRIFLIKRPLNIVITTNGKMLKIAK